VSFRNLLGGLALIVAVAVVIAAIPDVKRYIRISSM
jgi:hypothetical protein